MEESPLGNGLFKRKDNEKNTRGCLNASPKELKTLFIRNNASQCSYRFSVKVHFQTYKWWQYYLIKSHTIVWNDIYQMMSAFIWWISGTQSWLIWLRITNLRMLITLMKQDCFFEHCQQKHWYLKKKIVARDNMSKRRLTVLLCWNMFSQLCGTITK